MSARGSEMDRAASSSDLARRDDRRPKWRVAATWLLVFCGLLAWRFPYLTRPPYEDLAWLWQEANFLAEHDFDYYRLWTEEPRADQVVGGGRSYLISILPTFLAVLMKLCASSAQVFVVYHLVYLACGSAVATMLFWTLRERVGPVAAGLSVAAVLTTPAFSVRLEQLGMDLPMATAALGSGLLMWKQRYVGAAALSLLAFLLKPTGAIMTAANLSFLLVAIVGAPADGSGKRRRLWGAVAHAGVLAAEVGLIGVSGMMQIDRRWSPPSQVSVPRLRSAPYWVPDVMVVLAIGLVVSLMAAVWLVASAHRAAGRQTAGRWRRLAERLISDYDVPTLSWIVIGGSLLAMTKVLFMPRYLTLSIPFLYLILGSLLFAWRGLRPLGYALLAAIVVVNVVNSHGRLFPPLVEVHGAEFRRTNLFSPRASIALERSLEYRRDHESTIRALRLIESKWPDAPIFTDDTYYVYLTMPRLGYVKQPLRAYRISDYAAAVETYLELSRPEVPVRPVFLVGGLSGFTVAGPEPSDEVLYDDGEAIPLIAFRRRWPDGVPGEAARERWYFEHLCPGGRLMQPQAAADLARRRLERGELDRARRTLDMGLEQFASCRKLLLLSADVAIRQGRWDDATRFCDRALRLDFADSQPWGRLATLWAVRPVIEAHADRATLRATLHSSNNAAGAATTADAMTGAKADSEAGAKPGNEAGPAVDTIDGAAATDAVLAAAAALQQGQAAQALAAAGAHFTDIATHETDGAHRIQDADSTHDTGNADGTNGTRGADGADGADDVDGVDGVAGGVTAHDTGHTDDGSTAHEEDDGHGGGSLRAENNAARWMIRAAAWWRLGQLDRATACLNEVVATAPGHAAARLLLAVRAMQERQVERVETHLAQMEEDGRLKARAHVLAGTMRWQQGSLDAAAAHFAQALAADPQSVDARYYRGVLRLARGELAEAERELQAARDSAPEFSNAANALGVLWAKTSRAELARACFQQAVRADEHNVTARRNLAALLRQRMKPDGQARL